MARLTWTTIHVPFTTGLETKQDVRFSNPPSLDIARDVTFESPGGLRTRPPFAAMSNAIFGGGTLANCRRIDVINDELLVFTDTALYSWNAQLAQWVLRGTHLAVAVDEAPRFVTTGDQTFCDRAEVNGTIVYAWVEGGVSAPVAYAAAIDKVTGATLVPPTVIASPGGDTRVIALSTKILLFVGASNNLIVRAIDPANPAVGFAAAGTNVASGTDAGPYDIVRIGSTDQCIGAYQRTTPTSYTVFTVTAALAIASATKSRTADGPLAVAVSPSGTQVQIVRANGTAIQGDLLTISGFTDVFTAQAIGTVGGTPVNQITAAFSSTNVGGNFTASVWWSFQETNGVGGSTGDTKFNTVTTANVVGTQSTFVEAVGVASHAFERNGSVYVWLVWAKDNGTVVAGTPNGIRGAVQNTYYLYRNDGLLTAQAAEDIAGGYVPLPGRLPGISVAGNAYTWCGTWRRTIQLGANKVGNATRSPREITATFDAVGARRTARLGSTLYISGGLILQYDGTQIVEVGTLVFPWAIAAQDSGVAGGTSIGAYSWKGSVRWQSATGENERSTTATGVSLTLAANHIVFITTTMLFVTRKLIRPPVIEVWRTVVNAGPSSPFYLITSNDPSQVLPIANNPFIPNNPQIVGGSFVFNDNYSDATLLTQEANPENVGGLEHLAPPAASIIIATDTRIFLAGVAGDPDAVWPSRLRGENEIASFHDGLRVEIPRPGGPITAIWVQDDVLYVGRQWAIYALPGVGLDNNGQGQNYGPARIVSSDVGPVSQESQVLTPIGTLFKSAKGWQMLERAGTVHYVGGAVAAFDSDTVLAMHVMTAQHQVRVLTNNRLLLWDYHGAVDTTAPDWLGEWAEWTIGDGVHAAMWQGQYVYLTATGPKIEQAALTGLTYGIDVETSWIKLADLQGFGRLKAIDILGEYRSAHLLRVRVARDYQYDGAGSPAYFDDKAWTPSPAVVGSALQLCHSPSQGLGEAFKVRLTAVVETARATLVTNVAFAIPVSTNGSPWSATWAAVNPGTPGLSYPGTMGNALTMSFAFAAGASPSVDVRDNYQYTSSTGRWTERNGNIGVLVTGTNATTTVAQLEAAIAAVTKIATLQSADPAPAKLVAIATLAGQPVIGSFSGGSFGSPSGEALALTGVSLEVGVYPGIYNNLPAAQRQ